MKLNITENKGVIVLASRKRRIKELRLSVWKLDKDFTLEDGMSTQN